MSGLVQLLTELPTNSVPFIVAFSQTMLDDLT